MKKLRIGTLLLSLITASAHSEAIRGINFTNGLGGFELRRIFDNEEASPGLGVTLFYNTQGVKASVFVYDKKEKNIQDGVGSMVVKKEFAQARNEIASSYPEAKITVKEDTLLVQGIQLLHAEFNYADRGSNSVHPVISHLYLTAKKGNFIKVRATYSATNQPERGLAVHRNFVHSLCNQIAK